MNFFLYIHYNMCYNKTRKEENLINSIADDKENDAKKEATRNERKKHQSKQKRNVEKA